MEAAILELIMYLTQSSKYDNKAKQTPTDFLEAETFSQVLIGLRYEVVSISTSIDLFDDLQAYH